LDLRLQLQLLRLLNLPLPNVLLNLLLLCPQRAKLSLQELQIGQ
jgi:hypothetical protein